MTCQVERANRTEHAETIQPTRNRKQQYTIDIMCNNIRIMRSRFKNMALYR
jgi:hypothetical protein